MTRGWRLAQFNVARLKAPQGDPRVAGFFAALDGVNAEADAAPGFVWRLVGDGGDAADLPVARDPLLVVNLSLWRDAASLSAFVYRTGHAPVMARKGEWFDRLPGTHMALWWVPEGVIPTVADGLARLWQLDHLGAGPDAFTFKTLQPSPEAAPLSACG